MLWLSLAYEMSEGQAEAVRKGLLTKLSLIAQKMPRLQREVNVTTEAPSYREQLREQLKQQRGRLREEFEAGGGARENNTGTGTVGGVRSANRRPASRGNFGAGGFFGSVGGGGFGGFRQRGGIAVNVADDQSLIPFLMIDFSKSEGSGIGRVSSFRFWDTRTSSWAGPAIHINGSGRGSALHSGRKLFAVQVQTLISNGDDTDTATNAEPPRQFLQRVDIYDLTTGKLISQVQSERNFQAGPGFLRGVATGGLMQFNADGSQLNLISVRNLRSSNTNAFNIQSIDSETGEVLRDDEVVLKNATTRPINPAITLSADGRRLICRQLTASDGPRTGGPRTNVACYDVFTGDQIGQAIELGRGTPLVIKPDASQIAITRSVAGRTRIEVHDVESGEQVGESIELDLRESEVQLLNTSRDQSQIIVGMTRRLNLTQPSGPTSPKQTDETGLERDVLQSAVQVFDLKTSRPVTPPLPTDGIASIAVLSSRDQTLSVASESGVLRVWELPQSAVHPTLLPVESQRNRLDQIASAFRSVISGGEQGLVLVGRFVNQIAGSSSQVALGRNGRILTTNLDNGFDLETWDEETGQLIKSAQLPDLTNEFAGPVSAGGKFVFTVRPINVELEENQARGSGFPVRGPAFIKSFRLQVRCWQTDPVQQIGTPINLEENQAPVCISPDGNWIAIRTVNPEESGFGSGRGAGQRMAGGFGHRFQPPTASDSDASDSTESEPEPPSPPRPRLQLRHRTTGELRRVPLGPRLAEFHDARFSGDGRRLAVKSERIQVFDLSTEFIEPIAVTPLRVSAQTPANSRGGFATGRVGLNADVWAINFDGTLLAELVDEATLQIRQLTTGEIVGSLMNHPAAIDDVCFDLEGKKILTACADGLIRQWLLPEQWTGDAQAIRQRVEQHAGVTFMGDDFIVAQRLTDRATVGAEWLANDNRRQSTLTQSHRDALQQRFSCVALAERWRCATSSASA